MKQSDIEFFDPSADLQIIERKLPHWIQSGTLCFVTWRAMDSLPVDVRARIDREIAETLSKFNLDPNADWKIELSKRLPAERGRVSWDLFAVRDRFLDAGFGECLLARTACAKIVEDGLRKFDEDRYFLTDIVVMPNHVHFMAAFRDDDSFLKQCTDWKRYMAREINRTVGRTGDYWQTDQFDHLIRSPEQFDLYRRYIAENPIKANLGDEQYRHYQKVLIGT